MNNFNFSKVIAGVGPILAKETILSKVIWMVDVFRLSLSGGFDDNNKKYIETIMKLDNSKTIMLETKWCDVRVKNLVNIKLKKWSTINIDYSEYAQEWDKQVFVDYQDLWSLAIGTKIRFEQSDIEVEVIKINTEDNIDCKVLDAWELLQFDRVRFLDTEINFGVLTEKDKKDILWGIEYNIHMIALSGVNSPDVLLELKSFLKEHNKENMKIISKIETEDGLKNLDAINSISDGIIFIVDKIEDNLKKMKLSLDEMIKKIKKTGKPVSVSYISSIKNKNYPFKNKSVLKSFCEQAVDAFMLDHIIQEEDTLPIITEIYESLEKVETEAVYKEAERFDDNENFAVRDYIIYNAYRVSQELDIKAIVCFTDNGYTAARLSSLAPQVPVITFTHTDETYRYINMIRGTKWYKTSNAFNYEWLKNLGKEIIRIVFKGNISLDDKIVIVQSDEYQKDERTDMINGVELYKFKNI